MARKIREQSVSLTSYLKSVNSEDISENQDVQRMFCWDNAAINELILTVLNDDYIPPIILGEEELGGSLTQQYIVDGIQRTTALNKFRNMNWKTTRKFENGIIQYQSKRRDSDGHILRDENGSVLWDSLEFDIRNKTFDQLPDELRKKFDDYQIRIVIHQNCTMQEISKLVRRYNRNRSMSANQKAVTWLPTYARKIKNIAENEFFKNCVSYSSAMRKNGTYEQTVANSVMATFYMNDWKKSAKDRNEYLEDNASFSDFETINAYGNRIAEVCEDRFQKLFVFKDIPVWMAVFDNFNNSGLEDKRFADFLIELSETLHEKEVDGVSYDSLYKEPGTSDKKLVIEKIQLYTKLMNEFLGMNNVEKTDIEDGFSVLRFLRNTVDSTIEGDDVEIYQDMVEDCVRITDPIYIESFPALTALMAYACESEEDGNFEHWMKQYQYCSNNSCSQTTQYEHMKSDFDEFVNKGKEVR